MVIQNTAEAALSKRAAALELLSLSGRISLDKAGKIAKIRNFT